MVAHLLPPQVHVFVRDWLSANHVLLKSPAGHVLVDTGYVRHAPLTLALLASPRGLGAEPLAQVVNTHCHSDHMGGNAAVASAYGVRSWRVEDPAELGPVLRRATEHDGPALVDIVAQSLEAAAAPVLQWMG